MLPCHAPSTQTCKLLGYLLFVFPPKEMKIKAAVTIRSHPPPRFYRVSLCKMSVCKNRRDHTKNGILTLCRMAALCSIVHTHRRLLVKANKKCNISTVKMKTAISTFGLSDKMFLFHSYLEVKNAFFFKIFLASLRLPTLINQCLPEFANLKF